MNLQYCSDIGSNGDRDSDGRKKSPLSMLRTSCLKNHFSDSSNRIPFNEMKKS